MSEVVEVPLTDVKFVEKHYPRFNLNNKLVNRYRLNIENLPPIILTKENRILIEGYHRLTAHKVEGKETIKAILEDCPEDEILWRSAGYNSTWGEQLEIEEKRKLAQEFYKNNGRTQEQIAKQLGVSIGYVNQWVKTIREDKEKEDNELILDLYLRCFTQREISEQVGLALGTINTRLQKMFEIFKNENSEQKPESLQLYNVWNFGTRDDRYGLNGTPGQIPGQIIENVLYYYTEPFDLVVDPMAGGGTTLDVCREMKRRYLVYDIKPLRHEIQEHDIKEGFPDKAKNCDLIFLDPPYYNMVKEFEDFFKDVDDFYSFVELLAKHSYDTVKEGKYVAYLMAEREEDGQYFCLTGESYPIFRNVGFKCIKHFQVPLSTQQYQGCDVNRAKEQRNALNTSRDLHVFKKV